MTDNALEPTMSATTHPLTLPARAAFLHALADHFDAHPALADVVVHRPDHTGLTRLQISAQFNRELPTLIAWAESLAADTVTAFRYADSQGSSRVHVHVAGEIAGHLVDVWDAIPALDASTLDDGDEAAVDDLVELAAFAAAHVTRRELLAGAR